MNPSQLIYLLFLAELVLSGFWYTNSIVTQVFLLLTFIIGCRAVSVRGAVVAYPLFGLMLIYLAWLFIVAFNSEVPYTSMIMLATLANLPVIYMVASNTPTFAEIWKYLRLFFFVIGVFFALWALWQATNHVWYGAVVGPLHDSNLFAALMNVLWFPAAFLFLNSRPEHPWKPILIGSGLFIMSAALFATTSRGGIGAWGLLLPVLLWAGYRNIYSRRLVVFILLIAILAYFFTAQILQLSVFDRTFQLIQDPSTVARFLLWESAIKMALAHPVIGLGWGTFVKYYPVYRSPLESISSGFFVHNDYLQMAAEGGFISLLILLGVVLGLLLQVKRSLKRVGDLAGLESIALLLGVLALFIHAGVNFIFYLAFMNIFAGLYLARAAQLTEVPRIIVFPDSGKISVYIRKFLIGFCGISMAIYLVPDLVAYSLNSQSNIKITNIESPKVTAYQIAKWVTEIKPQEHIAQEIVLQTAELALADNDFVNRVGVDFQHKLVKETLERFDSIRALSANTPNIGVRQARLLIEHADIVDRGIAEGGMTAYGRAHHVLEDNLKADPYHVDSIILLAHLYILEGRRNDALHTLKQAEHSVLGHVNQSLITIEILRLLAAPKIIPELAEIEEQLHLVNLDTQVYILSVIEGHFNEDIDTRLSAIAGQISQ